MLKFEGCTFNAAGANNKAKVYGLTILGDEDVVINDCVFESTGYAALLNQGTGTLTVKDTEFHCANNYNVIEGGQTMFNGDVTIEDCDFTGSLRNNFINFYQVADGSTHTIKGCTFAGGYNNNVIRLSNKENTTAIFNVSDCSYTFNGGTPDEYTGFILCQDYTNRSGNKQDFTKYTVNINNLTRPQEGSLVYVYDDGEGIIVTNYPVVTLDGHPLLFSENEAA